MISFKMQNYLTIIPYLGFFLVIFTSFYNIYKVKNIIFVGIYYLLTLIPCLFFLLIAAIVFKSFIWGNEYPLMIILSLLLFFVIMLCMAIVCLGIEKSIIKRFMNVDNFHIK